eukprot:365563-Chlamydomonas_euryale.AAC.2
MLRVVYRFPYCSCSVRQLRTVHLALRHHAKRPAAGPPDATRPGPTRPKAPRLGPTRPDTSTAATPRLQRVCGLPIHTCSRFTLHGSGLIPD